MCWFDHEKVADALHGIGCGFDWGATPQGALYWNDVHIALKVLHAQHMPKDTPFTIPDWDLF